MEPAAQGEGRDGRRIVERIIAPVCPDGASEHARRLIDSFGSVPAILAASPIALERETGGCAAAAGLLGLVREAMVHSLRWEVVEAPVLATSPQLIDYLRISLAQAADEEFRVLYLNSRNLLLREETVATGTPNEVSVHPRIIAKRALELGATALILVHNHPSGSPDPSPGDIQTTARIVRAARTLDIVVHDHIIVARSGWRSFRQSGLLA